MLKYSTLLLVCRFIMKNMFNKIVFGSSLFLSALAFAETEENKDTEPVTVVCTGENCPAESNTQEAPVEVIEEQASENK